MKHAPEITIGMPVFNGGGSVERAIKSALDQTFKNFILLIADNASTDSTNEVCRRFERLDERIKVHRHLNNIGVIQNFHFLLEQAKTPYFVWLAHDDWWAPDFLKENWSNLKTYHDAVCSVSRAQLLSRNGENLRHNPGTYALVKESEVSIRQFLRMPACNSRFYGLFKTRELQESFRPSDVYWAFDWVVMARTLTFGKHYESEKKLLFRTISRSPARSLQQRIKGFSECSSGRIFPMLNMARAVWKDSGIPNTFEILAICVYWNIRMFLVVNIFSRMKQGSSRLVKKALGIHLERPTGSGPRRCGRLSVICRR